MNPELVKKPLKPDDLYQLLERVQNNGQKIRVTIQCRRDAPCHGKSEEGGTTLMVENSLWVVTNSNRNLYSDAPSSGDLVCSAYIVPVAYNNIVCETKGCI